MTDIDECPTRVKCHGNQVTISLPALPEVTQVDTTALRDYFLLSEAVDSIKKDLRRVLQPYKDKADALQAVLVPFVENSEAVYRYKGSDVVIATTTKKTPVNEKFLKANLPGFFQGAGREDESVHILEFLQSYRDSLECKTVKLAKRKKRKRAGSGDEDGDRGANEDGDGEENGEGDDAGVDYD